MRLAAWNANFNNRKRSYEADVALLDSLNADLIVLSETARPVVDELGWVGAEAPGLVVMARNGYSVTAHERNADAPSFSGGFRVDGPCGFNLLAAWPTPQVKTATYHKLLMQVLEHFAGMRVQERVVLASGG